MNQVIHQLRSMMLRDGVEPTDGQLLEIFLKDRVETALEGLVRRHGAMVWGVCRRVLANHHDAEDAFQATFLVLVRKASTIKPRDMVGNWLYGVAHQTALKARARSAKRQAREKQVIAMPEPAAAPTNHADDLARLLDQELRRLPDKYRAVLVLCELEGKALKEAAAQLGVPEGTVASRLVRGRAMLAKRLARHNLAISAGALPALLAQQAAGATVPAAILSTTIKAVCQVAAGKGAALLSLQAAALTEEVVKAMFLTKIGKISAVLLLVIASCSLGYGAYASLGGGPKEIPVAGADKKDPLAQAAFKLAPLKIPARQPDEKDKLLEEPEKLKILNLSSKFLKDDDLLQLPEDIDGLIMRGRHGYGANSVTDEGIKHLTRFTRLRILAAGGLELTDRAMETIGKLTRLEELSLEINKITGAGLRHLRGLKNLRKLNLDFNQLQPDDLEPVSELTGLTSLRIYSTGIVNDRVCELCSRLKNLRELHLSERMADLTDRGVQHLAKLRHLENLTLRGCPKITDASLAAITGMTRLKTLRLTGLPPVTPKGMKGIGKLTELRVLEINVVSMDDASIRALESLTKLEDFLLWSVASRPHHPSLDSLGALRSLRRFRTNMSMPSSAIRALAKLPDLESINDELFEITDEDLTHLAKLPKLKTLVLGSEKITVASLPTLAKMKSLRYLYVTDKVGITPEQWTQFGRDSLPQCNIGSYRAPYTVYHKGAE
jgi:RNA polymerase sigma factor (sigma-70 family)